jgi:hypothetical protein
VPPTWRRKQKKSFDVQMKNSNWRYGVEYYAATTAIQLAEKLHADLKPQYDAARAAYEKVHTKLRAVEIKETEAKLAAKLGLSVEAYRAQVQPIKDTYISHAKKLIGILTHITVWNEFTIPVRDETAHQGYLHQPCKEADWYSDTYHCME